MNYVNLTVKWFWWSLEFHYKRVSLYLTFYEFQNKKIIHLYAKAYSPALFNSYSNSSHHGHCFMKLWSETYPNARFIQNFHTRVMMRFHLRLSFSMNQHISTNLVVYPWDVQAGFDMEYHVCVDFGALCGRGQWYVTVTWWVESVGHKLYCWNSVITFHSCLKYS